MIAQPKMSYISTNMSHLKKTKKQKKQAKQKQKTSRGQPDLN